MPRELIWVNKPYLDYDIRDGTAYLEYVGVIKEDIVFRCDYVLLDAMRKGAKRAELIIQSLGGDVFAAIAFFYLLKSRQKDGFNIATKVCGAVASAAVTPFMAGEPRLASPHSLLMIHDVINLINYPYRTTSSQEHDAKMMRKIQSHLTTIEYESLRPKTLTIEQMEELKKHDFWMSASEAKNLGFVDRIVE